MVAKVHDRREFITFLERVLEELYDFHCNLNTNTDASAVLVPTDADLWAEWRNGHAIITDVRGDSPASRAKIQPGAEVVAFNGVPIRKAVEERLGNCLRIRDVAAENWALQTLLAGRHNEPQRHIDLRLGTEQTTVTLDSAHREFSNLVEYRTIGKDNDIGYIRPNNSLGDTQLIAEFDKALASLKETKGLVLDLRETPSGGNTVVARALMGRFLDREMFYQKHSIPAEERAYGVKRSWVEIVSPRGPFRYEHPVVVLVNHWTGSMGEGIALGMDATKRAQVVGVEMARLLGATDGLMLPNTQIMVHFATEKLYHPNGTPRERFVPGVYVNLLKDTAALGDDPILVTGMKTLREQIKPTR
jgi:carboxyl-terminal processing protease